MKKIASILLSVSIGLLSLTGCGGGKAPQRADGSIVAYVGNARFDMGLKHLSAMDGLLALGLNPDMHPTLESCVEGVTRMVGNLRKDLSNQSPTE